MAKVGTRGGTAVGIGVGLGTAPLTGPGGVVADSMAGTAADEIHRRDHRQRNEGQLRRGHLPQRTGLGRHEGFDLNACRECREESRENSANSSPLIVSAAATAAEQGFNNAGKNAHDALDGEGIPRQLEKEE
ncbi:hypothetical protein [Streptomyces sp. MAR25Y5]|uniref:hypothetical protein n=1 Tax=Streptomyces sp. MAR25Y5 TaxID=2962028 RepID=UPI0020B75DE3|nr:hypothetical protein [Streptomyces sp. MAR25Y5]MCP3770353.1 hypothetical protein [Streptomyces sp. MAR25Y5]